MVMLVRAVGVHPGQFSDPQVTDWEAYDLDRHHRPHVSN